MGCPAPTPPCPSWAGFLQFLQNVVQVPSSQLPSNNPGTAAAQMCYEVALATVNDALLVSPMMYVLAVYNLATDRMINFMPDLPDQSYWKDLRGDFGINSISLGVVVSGSDQGTSMSQMNPETFALLTLQDIQTLKTPWGRTYIGIAQAYGPNLWGLS